MIEEEQNDAPNAEARNLLAALHPKPGLLSLCPFPPGLAINMPRPPAGLPYPASNVGIIAPPPPPQRLQMMPMVSVKRQFWVRVLHISGVFLPL